MSVATVPKFTVIVGSSHGAGNYALCGRAYDPALILAWPNVRFAVMGGNQAADTMLSLRVRDAEKTGIKLSAEAIDELRESLRSRYAEQTDIRYGQLVAGSTQLSLRTRRVSGCPPHCRSFLKTHS